MATSSNIVRTQPDFDAVAHAPGVFGLELIDGELASGGVKLRSIAEEFGTPTYVYNADMIAQQVARLRAAFERSPVLMCYAVKANSTMAILRLVAELDCGADIVSGGELMRALKAGIPASKIVYSGVGKRVVEIDAALSAGVLQFNVESVSELDLIAARAAALQIKARVALRVNPEVDPKTHPYLATGLRESKFGIAMGDAIGLASKAHGDDHVEFVGLAFHIGSMIDDAAAYLDALTHVRRLVGELRGMGIPVPRLDLGGGLSIPYAPEDPVVDVAAFGQAIHDATHDLNVELIIEPGRFLVGNAGVLLTEVLGTKHGADRSFVVVDAAMNDLMRPALYQAHHTIVPVTPPSSTGSTGNTATYDVVGPVCECGDFLGQARPLHEPRTGEFFAVLSAGAYGIAMASTYNSRPLPAEVMTGHGRLELIRARPSLESLMDGELLPQRSFVG